MEIIQNQSPDFDFAKVYAALAFCYTQHCHYYDEAYEVTKTAINLCSKKLRDLKSSLKEQYIDLLIYKRRFSKAIRIWNKNKKCFGKETKALICLLKNNLLKQNNDPDLNYEAWWSDTPSQYDVNALGNSTRTLFTMVGCMRKVGHFEQALDIMEQVGIGHTHFGINYEICAYESDVKQSALVIKRMEKALENSQELWLLTINCFLSMNSVDPIKFFNIVRKDLQSSNGSRKLKKSAGKVKHFFNSVDISLFIRKKLKQHLPQHLIFMQPLNKEKLLF